VKVANAHKRLLSVWGRVDAAHNQLILKNVAGTRVLDVGCGYGALTHFLQQRGFDVVGVERDRKSVSAAHELFPDANVRLADADNLDFPDRHFDTVILKDTLHHVFEQDDTGGLLDEILRMLKVGGSLIVFDPNPQPLIRLCRKLVFHVDPECTPNDVLGLLEGKGFRIKSIEYSELLALPLSGGYVGPQLFPNWPFLVKGLLLANDLLGRMIGAVGLGRFLLWRYNIHAVKTSQPPVPGAAGGRLSTRCSGRK
jgi:SAM-dependent methyltransferase